MRYIDDIIHAVREHPYFSDVHKQVIIARLEPNPTREELVAAHLRIKEDLRVSEEKREDGKQSTVLRD